MRTFLFFLSITFIILIVYRRIIEPFLEGVRGVRKQYNQTNERNSSKNQGRHGLPIDKEIKDAEFKEIQ